MIFRETMIVCALMGFTYLSPLTDYVMNGLIFVDSRGRTLNRDERRLAEHFDLDAAVTPECIEWYRKEYPVVGSISLAMESSIEEPSEDGAEADTQFENAYEELYDKLEQMSEL